MAEPRWRVAVVGAGIGREHIAGFRELPGLFRVATVCDLNTARAAEVAAAVPGCAVTADLEAVLADPAIDIVDICLPPHLHFAAVGRVLDAGKHAICEKPLVTSLAEADALIARAGAAGRLLAPVFQYRFGPGFQRLRRLIDAGLAGRPLVAALETHWNRGPDYYAVPWRGTWAGEQGGAVLGHAIHIHDLVCAALGPVRRVGAFVATRVNPIEVEDCAALTFEMESGALVTSSVTLGAATDMSRLRFCFERLTAESDTSPYHPGGGRWRFTARAPAAQAAVDAALAAVADGPERYAGLFAELARALDGAPSAAVTAADARRSIELVTAIYHAARTGAAATLPIGSEHPLYRGWSP
ncbi:MAG: Gfo/Idh/MocA family oxidoreductase [Alphaproteobacteria bacterium]